MRYHNSQKKDGTITTRVMCAILFCAFSFSWLYWFQADVIAVGQHVLSKGVTRFDRTIGTLVVTAVLLVLQQIIAAVVRLNRRSHALTYLPSMLILAIISDISADIDLRFSLGAWYWVAPLVLIVWGLVVWMAKNMLTLDSDKDYSGVFSRRVWINALIMFVMMLSVAAIGNTNATFHFRSHAEVALQQGDIEEALRVGNESFETDEHLTMLRIYALSRQYQLGERLFRYPIAGTSSDMLPLPIKGSRSRLILLPTDSIWVHLGGRPASSMDAKRYLVALKRSGLATQAVADYVLCGHLIDRDIDAFVRDLPKYYVLKDSVYDELPFHYREALTLYTHRRTNPSIIYHNAVMDEDWSNLQELERSYPDARERMGKVAERYQGSYWYYYSYEEK
jgi:hypothetical protein